MDEVMIRVLAAGIGVAVVAGALGCFVVWRRMAYFGDSLAHTALLGVALGLLYGFNVNLGIIAVCAVFAILLVWLQHKKLLATDTLLGILAHAALSIGMVAISFSEDQDIDLHDYLFGDIMSVMPEGLLLIYGGGIIVLGLLIANWSSLLLMAIDEDLARAEGIHTFRMHLLLMFLMTIVVAVSLQIVGILLIASILIIPAATARQFSHSPEGMAILAALLGVIATVGGVFSSITFNTPAGPTIVTTAALMFTLLMPVALYIQKRNHIAKIP